jgi:Spy/CpxP family protein refolding chaperone
MKRIGQITVVLAVVAMASGSAQAQQQNRRGFGGFGGSPIFLLNQKSVQEELKLTEDQVTKVKELSEKQRESFRGLRDLSQEERQKKVAESAKANAKAVAEILKPEQLKRVKQITLQRRGAQALGDPEVAKTLNLTGEQKDKLKTIQDEVRQARGNGQRGDRSEEAQKKRAEARKATNEKLMGVLTAEQKTKLKELMGEPFKGAIEFNGRTRPNR